MVEQTGMVDNIHGNYFVDLEKREGWEEDHIQCGNN
jgi:hypothetical protein